MATVPSSGNSVRLQSVRQNFAQTDNTAIAGAQAVAQGVEQAGAAIDMGLERRAADEAFKAETAVRAQWLEHDAQLRKRYRGDKVEGYREEVDAWWSKQRETLAADMSPRGRELAGRNLGSFARQEQARSLGYYENETDKAQAQNFDAAQGLIAQQAAASVNPTNAKDILTTAARDLESGVARFGAARGWSTEQMSRAAQTQRGALALDAVKVLETQDASLAMKLLEEHRDAIEPSAYAAALARTEQHGRANLAEASADGILAKFKLSDNAPVPIEQMLAAAREAAAGDDQQVQAVAAAVKRRVSEFRDGEKERNAGRIDVIMNAMAAGTPQARIEAMEEWQGLGGARQRDLRNARLSDATARQNLEIGALDREQRLRERKGYVKYSEASDPAVLKTLSEADLMLLRPVIGDKLHKDLVEDRRKLDNPKRAAEITLDKDLFNKAAQAAGLKPFEKGKDEQEQARLGSMHLEVKEQLRIATETNGKPLTEEQKTAVVNKAVAQQVRAEPLFGIFGGGPKAVLALDDKKLMDTPDAKKMADALKKRGLDASPDAVRSALLQR